jgi:hypothetical protein
VEGLTVGAVARDIAERTGTSVPPHVISNLYYRRILDNDLCRVVCGVRLIPPDYVPVIEAELRRRGFLRTALPEVPPCQ